MAVPVGTLIPSYGSPIVQSRTAWTPVRVSVPGQNVTDWPPAADEERLALYANFLALVENRPYDVFERLRLAEFQLQKIVLALALPELLCNVWADAVWGEDRAVDVSFESDAVQRKWDVLAEANDLEVLGWESVFGAAFRGTSVLQVIRAEENVDLIGSEVRVQEISPAIFFPHLIPGSDREYDAVTLAWEEARPNDGGRDELWQVRQEHYLEAGQYVILKLERRSSDRQGTFRSVGVERPVGIDFLPFVDLHAKRWGGRYWGVSELSRNLTLFNEIDDRPSDIAEILDYHGKPVLQVPSSFMFGGVLSKGADRVYGVNSPETAQIARYITFDGQIDAQLKSVDRTIELAMLTSEVPMGYFGVTEGLADSGTAVRLRLQNYLKKAARWQRSETRRLRKLADMLLRLDDAVAGGPIADRAARIPNVTHGSPLPADEEQEARIETALYGGGLSSRKTSITRLRRVDNVDEEIGAIEEEEESSVAPAGGGGLPGIGSDQPPQGRATREPPA